jgi:hypothetical protein
LEQPTATSEVLKVISSSPGELEPVFKAMLEKATTLCEAPFGGLFLRDAGLLRLVASHVPPSAPAAIFQPGSQLAVSDNAIHPLVRMIDSKAVAHINDMRTDQSYVGRNPRIVAFVETVGARTVLCVPMLKDNEFRVLGFGSVLRACPKKNITSVTDRRIAAGERTCAHERVIMSSQPSSFRRTDIKRAVQAMQAAGLGVARVELPRGTVLIIPAEEDGGAADDKQQRFRQDHAGQMRGGAMTVLHKDEPLSMKGVYPESHNCIDCGCNTAPGCPPRELAEFLMNRDGSVPMTYTGESEVYIVRNSVWKKAGIEPYGGCLCVGCLERRIGRRLKPNDFPGHPLNNPAIPCTERWRDRRDGAA